MQLNLQKQINIRTYGNETKPQSDCVLFCPHGDAGENFLEQNSFLPSLCQTDEKTLRAYLTLEQDTGTSELVHATAKILAATNDLRVDVFESKIPRGIFDIGRWTAARAIRNVCDQTSHRDLVTQLTETHAKIIKTYTKLLHHLSPRGVWLDVHSMAPFSPAVDSTHGPDPVNVAPGKFDDYISWYTDPKKFGKKRVVNVAVGLVEEPSVVLADTVLTQCIVEVLTNAKTPYNYNDPHPMSYVISAAQFMKRFSRGLLIDIPKQLLCIGSDVEVAQTLTQPELDHAKIKDIAYIISTALSRALEVKNAS